MLYKKVIGIIVPELSSSNYTVMVNAVSDLLKCRGFSVMVAVSNLDRDEEGLLLDRFAAVGVSAYLPLALSTISMPHELHGGIAARLLIDRAENGQPPAVEHIRGEAVFSPRETTAPLQSYKPLDLS